MANFVTDEITNRVFMGDIFSKYNFKPNRNGFINCPFHTEKTASLKAYADEKRFKCFGCGISGSVIDFVINLFNLDFRGALIKINYDFSLGLPLRQTLTAKQRADIRKKTKEREDRRQQEQMAKQAKEELYWLLWDTWIKLDRNKANFEPKTINEPIHRLFAESLNKMSYIEYLIDVFT